MTKLSKTCIRIGQINKMSMCMRNWFLFNYIILSTAVFCVFYYSKKCIISFLVPEQITEKDPVVCVQRVRDQEGIVPRPFSQLHPLCPLSGCGLYHLRVHEAGPPPELAVVFLPSKSFSRSTSVLPSEWSEAHSLHLKPYSVGMAFFLFCPDFTEGCS